MYWDMANLLYTEQIKFINSIMGVLRHWHADSHVMEWPHMFFVFYRHFLILEQYRDKPDEIIDHLAEIRDHSLQHLNDAQSNIFYRVWNKLLNH